MQYLFNNGRPSSNWKHPAHAIVSCYPLYVHISVLHVLHIIIMENNGKRWAGKLEMLHAKLVLLTVCCAVCLSDVTAVFALMGCVW